MSLYIFRGYRPGGRRHLLPSRISPPLPNQLAAVAALPRILKDCQILSRVGNAGRFKHDNERS